MLNYINCRQNYAFKQIITAIYWRRCWYTTQWYWRKSSHFFKMKTFKTLSRAWYGMEWNGKWNGMEISVWNMEDARMEWNGRLQEWNGRQSSILPYQFHTRFRALYLEKKTYWCRVVINNIVTEVFNFNILRISFVDKSRYLVVNIAQIVYVLHHCK